jgi:hypothetical protein
MKLLLLTTLFALVSCGTTIPLSTGKFKTYADADSISVTDGTVAVTMQGVNHSKVNETWAASMKSVGGDTLKTVRHAITVGGIVDVANSLTGLAKDKLATDAATRQAEISAGTKAAELGAANDALKITTPQ